MTAPARCYQRLNRDGRRADWDLSSYFYYEAAHATADALADAASYLDAHGWCQGDLYQQHATSGFPLACVHGALRLVVFGHSHHGDIPAYPCDGPNPQEAVLLRATEYLADYLCRWNRSRYDLPADVVTRWNDTLGRTATEVTETLRAVAYYYEADNADAQSRFYRTMAEAHEQHLTHSGGAR